VTEELGNHEPRKGWRRFSAWLIWLALAAGIVAAAILIPWKEAWGALADADKAWIALALLVYLANAPLAATLWWLFIPDRFHVAWPRVFEITALTATVRAALPLLAGDASSLGLLTLRGGLEPSAGLLVILLDQLFIGIGKVAVLCATLAFAPLPPFLLTAGRYLIAATAIGLVVMLAVALYERSFEKFASLFPEPLARPLRWLGNVAGHLELLRSPSRTAAASAIAVARKCVELGVTLAVQRAVGIHLPIWSACLLVTALDLATMIPGPPSAIGIFEAAVIFIYRFLGVPPAEAVVAGVLQHAIYLCGDFGCGYAVLLVEQVRRRSRPSPQGGA
jgi:uncharacterized membrane protein YbhN (UPF0104 family)